MILIVAVFGHLPGIIGKMEILLLGVAVQLTRLGFATPVLFVLCRCVTPTCLTPIIQNFQPGTPQARPYEAPTPGSGWANTPGVSFNDAPTPRDNYGIEIYLIIY